jgi:C_GCAxxG_C_C family probable redox protein
MLKRNFKEKAVQKFKELSEEQRSQLIREIGETACRYGKAYRGCSQWALYALQEHFELSDKAVFRAASALAGGIAGNGEICGALVGGLMAIGLAYGRDKLETVDASPAFGDAMERGAKLCDRFKNELGSLTCREVQKRLFGRSWDLRNPEEKKQFFSREDIGKCSDFVIKKVACVAAEIILEPQ